MCAFLYDGPRHYSPVQGAVTCPHTEYPIVQYTLHLNNTLTGSTTTYLLPPPPIPTPTLTISLDSNDGLEQDTHYIYYITAESHMGSVPSLYREMGKLECYEEGEPHYRHVPI